MATVEFSIPFWGNVELRTTTDVYQYVEQAQKHSVEKDIDQFSRLQTTAYLLMSFAMAFFEAFPKGLKALGEGSIYYLLGENETAKDAFFDHGEASLKNLGFAVYQLFLTLDALAFPSEVNERLTLQKPVELTPGLISNNAEHITNVLMFQNQGLRNQIAFLQNELRNGSESSAIEGLLKRNEEYESRMGTIILRAKQEVEFANGLTGDKQRKIEERDRQLEDQKQRYEHQVRELQGQHETDERFWQYIEENLRDSWQGLTGEKLLEKLEYVRKHPGTVRNYFRYKSRV